MNSCLQGYVFVFIPPQKHRIFSLNDVFSIFVQNFSIQFFNFLNIQSAFSKGITDVNHKCFSIDSYSNHQRFFPATLFLWMYFQISIWAKSSFRRRIRLSFSIVFIEQKDFSCLYQFKIFWITRACFEFSFKVNASSKMFISNQSICSMHKIASLQPVNLPINWQSTVIKKSACVDKPCYYRHFAIFYYFPCLSRLISSKMACH